MNQREQRQEEDLARLIQAGFNRAVRPEPATRQKTLRHLQALCRAEYGGPAAQSPEPVEAGSPATAKVFPVESVINRVRPEQPQNQNNNKHEGDTLMKLIAKYRWGWGLGAAAAAAAIMVSLSLATPKAQARAADVLAKGARAIAKLSTVHFRGQMRTLPNDNFSLLSPDLDFCSIELWKEFEPGVKWRIEKPERVLVVDGQQAIEYIKPVNTAYKAAPVPNGSGQDDWLQRIANLSATISNELVHAQSQGWKLGLTEETAADGRLKSVVTVQAKSGLPEDDYWKNKFLWTADTRRVYRFDAQTERLEAVQIYLDRGTNEVQIFELSQIDYNQPIDPGLWKLELPADVSWFQEPQKLPDNDKYASMTAEEAARAFFEACAREDWNEAGKFTSPVNEWLKVNLGGLQLVSLGKAFTARDYAGRFVPYEIILRGQELNLRLSNNNSAKRYVITGVYDRNLKLQQDLKWSKEPEILPDNDAYAKMSPAEVVKAYAAAQSKLDWTEMKKFAPDNDVDDDKRQLETAEKLGADVHKIMPVMEAGEAFWSAEHSTYFVKCRVSQTKKWNLAVRKDNRAGRWQVDGGI